MLRLIKRKRQRAEAIAKHVADGWCGSIGPNTGAVCQWRAGHQGNHRREHMLDPVIVEEWCDPRMGERYDCLADHARSLGPADALLGAIRTQEER